jgi:hypothetical protein
MNEQTSRGKIDEAKKWPFRNPDRPSRGEAIEALRAEGVDTVEGLVDRLLAFRHPLPRLTRGESVLARTEAQPATLENIYYQPPQVPLYVDGVSVDPADISRFNGQVLNFVVTKSTLHAFTGNDHITFLKGAYADSLASRSSLATAMRYPMTAAAGPRASTTADLLTFDCPFSYGQVQMFQDIDYGNNWFWLGANSVDQDLRFIERGCFLWWCGDWNDQISSMGATDTKVIYYWDINFSGPTLTVYPYFCVPDLRVYGWNDEISSIWNVGY